MADIRLTGNFLRNTPGFTFGDGTGITWSFDSTTNKLTAAVSAGTTTIADHAVTNIKLAQMAQSTIKGRAAAAGTGDPVDLTAPQVKTILALASTDLSDFTEAAQDAAGSLIQTSTTIAPSYNDAGNALTLAVIDGTVTYVKIQNVSATNRVLGRITAGAGTVEELTGANIGTIIAGITPTWSALHSFSAGLRVNDGLIGTPPIAFTAETNTGIYRRSAGNMTLVALGNDSLSATNTQVFAWLPVRTLSDGSTSTPQYSFNNETTLGIYRVGAGILGVAGALQVSGKLGVNGTTPITKPAVTGSRGANAALASLLTALASYGLITDSTTV